jgi:hypothetical protein
MNLLGEKRSTGILQSHVTNITILVIIFINLVYFINNISSGKLIEEQVLAKQIALLIDSAKPGTEIIINVQDFLVEISGNEVKVKSEVDKNGYAYDFFVPYKIEQKMEGNNLILRIS